MISDFKQTQSLYSPYVQVYLVETKYLDRATMVFNFSDSTETKIYKATIKFDMDDRHGKFIIFIKLLLKHVLVEGD